MGGLIYIEVTNTLQAIYLTGIQRVTKQLVRHLMDQSDRIRLVTYSPRFKNFRYLSEREISRLLSWQQSVNYKIPGYYLFLQIWRKLVDWITSKKRLVNGFEPGSVFLEIEAAWHNPLSRDLLLPKLLAEGIKPVVVHYDLIPVVYPEYVHPETIIKFNKFMEAHASHTGNFVCISDWSRQVLSDHLATNFPGRQFNYGVISMCPFLSSTAEATPGSKKHQNHLLCVGTLEIRKNHKLLLECLEKLIPDYPDLEMVFVGKSGWLAQDVLDKIRHSEYFGKNLFWYSGISDHELCYLYTHAFLTVMPSYIEGFGLPVIESLSMGCPVLSSDRGALPEAGGHFVEYFDPDQADELIALIKDHLDDPDHHASLREKAKTYVPPTWANSAKQLLKFINQIQH